MLDRNGTELKPNDGVLIVRSQLSVEFDLVSFDLREEPTCRIYWGRIKEISTFGAKVVIGNDYVTVWAQSAHLLKCDLIV